MVNSMSDPGNVTLTISYAGKVDDVTRNVFMITAFLSFTFFFYFIVIMLKVFFTTPHMQENPRYILFVHMLINDTLYIIITNVVATLNMHSVYVPMIYCFVNQALSSCAFRVTPYNLALMSLERYVAICFPLRHLQLCTPRRAKTAIAVIWIIGLSLSIANLMTTIYSAKITSYFIYVLCDGSMLMISPIQNVVRTIINILSFTTVALIIVFTYIHVMLVARRIDSGGSSALKASKTVMLHGFQLMLCMASFISTLTETYMKNYMYYLIVLNYLLYVCVPRFLSPLIYGLRDEVFFTHIKKYCSITRVCRPQ